MIVYLAKGVNFLALMLQNTIIFTSSIGQVIVLLITTAFTTVHNLLKYILLFFQIIYEDNAAIFTDDLPKIYDTIHYQWCNICNIVSTVTNNILNEVNLLTSNLKSSLSSIIFMIGEVLQILVKAILIFGDALWLLLTFVPVHLPYLIKGFLKYVKDCLVSNAIDAYMALLRVTNFLSEVPLESFMGIITAIIIARSWIHFRDTIHSHIIGWYWILVRKVTYLYHMIYNYCTNSEVRMIARLVGGQQLTLRNSDIDLTNGNDEEPADITDALCIICQERQKCVLTLPCRHVCLCTECCMRLYGYQRTCPICRTFIYHSVNVYL